MERPAEDQQRPSGSLAAVPSIAEDDAPPASADAGIAPASRETRRKERHPRARRSGAIATHARELGAAALMAAGVALVVLGWWGAAHSELFIDQVPYLISGGLLGLGLIVTAAVLGASVLNERAMRELRHDIVLAIGARAAGPGPAKEGTEGPGRVMLVPGGRSYHLPGCPIPEGKHGVEETDLADAAGRGFVACKLCGPE